VTYVAVITVSEAGLVLEEVAPGWSVEEVQALTEPKVIVGKNIREMEL
jgi:3-oxoacid CoA-transferase subunit B